jgi:general secretion pathway protein M
MKQLREQLRAAWAARQPRERLFLVALAIFIAGALLVQGVWSARNDSARLRKQIPQLRMQAEVMQRQANELRQLQALPKPASAALEGNALLAAAGTAAKVGGLGVAPAQLQLEGPRQVRLRATLPFDRWLEWIAVVQADLRLRLVRCQVDGTADPGLVNIDALLAVPDSV